MFTVPPATSFLRLEWPPPDLLAVAVAASLAAGTAVTALARLQRLHRPEHDPRRNRGRR
jgi:cation-transporting ATPase E